MSAKSRRKGQAGERELAAEIHAATGWTVKRRVRQHAGDTDLEGVPGWAAESKRYASATRAEIAGWWAQTVSQAGADKPVLFFRLNRCEWRAVWPLGLHLGGDWIGYDMTVEGSVKAWAAVARETRPQPWHFAATGAGPSRLDSEPAGKRTYVENTCTPDLRVASGCDARHRLRRGTGGHVPGPATPDAGATGCHG